MIFFSSHYVSILSTFSNILLIFQAYHGHHHAMEVLVQSLLDLDVRNSQGCTPLDLAAFKGHVECVDVLINQGASILVKDFNLKRTPIHAAGKGLFSVQFLHCVGFCYNVLSQYLISTQFIFS